MTTPESTPWTTAAILAVAVLACGADAAWGADCPPLTISAADTATELAILDEMCPRSEPWTIINPEEPSADEEEE